jgi:hypothetical protein
MTIAVIVLAIALLNLHYLIFLTLNMTDSENRDITDVSESDEAHRLKCFPVHDSSYHTFLVYWWPWFDLLIFSLVPFVIMSTCSAVILVTMRKSSEKVFYNTSRNRSSLTGGSINLFQKRLRRNRQILYMLVLTNLYFLLSSMPYFVMAVKYQGEKMETPTAHALVQFLLYTNNAINFVFFGFSCEKYRGEFLKVFWRKRSSSEAMIMMAPVSTRLLN